MATARPSCCIITRADIRKPKDSGKTYRSAYKMEDEPVLPLSLGVHSTGTLILAGLWEQCAPTHEKEGRRLDLQVESRYLTDLPKV